MDFRDSHEILFNLHQITKIAAVYWTKKTDEVGRELGYAAGRVPRDIWNRKTVIYLGEQLK